MSGLPEIRIEDFAGDFWLSSGHILLERSEAGSLILTDAFLKAYLARPELMPPPEACLAEIALHQKLMAAPRAPVAAREIEAIADADARENWRVMLDLRDRLAAAPTIEAAYCRLIRDGAKGIPPLFLSHLAHVIMRAALDGTRDAFIARAGELFYRAQRASTENGRLLLADMETADMRRHEIHASPLLAMFAGETANLDILKTDNAEDYWARSDAYDMVFDLGSVDGRLALAKALNLWVRQILGHDLTIEPVERIEDPDVRWIAGLDAEGSRLANALWRGEGIEEDEASRLLAIFTVAPGADTPFLDTVAGRPVYLLLAMDQDRIVRMKPQNLVTCLPLHDHAMRH